MGKRPGYLCTGPYRPMGSRETESTPRPNSDQTSKENVYKDDGNQRIGRMSDTGSSTEHTPTSTAPSTPPLSPVNTSKPLIDIVKEKFPSLPPHVALFCHLNDLDEKSVHDHAREHAYFCRLRQCPYHY